MIAEDCIVVDETEVSSTTITQQNNVVESPISCTEIVENYAANDETNLASDDEEPSETARLFLQGTQSPKVSAESSYSNNTLSNPSLKTHSRLPSANDDHATPQAPADSEENNPDIPGAPSTEDDWYVCRKCSSYCPPCSQHCPLCMRCLEVAFFHSRVVNNCIGGANVRFYFQFVCYLFAYTLALITFLLIQLLSVSRLFKFSNSGRGMWRRTRSCQKLKRFQV